MRNLFTIVKIKIEIKLMIHYRMLCIFNAEEQASMHNWENIIIGLELAIIFQLIIIGILNVCQKEAQYVFLGIFSILIANLIIFYIDLIELKQYKILYFFIGGAKNQFYGPILFLYLKSINQRKMKRYYFFHLLFPMLIYILSQIKYYYVENQFIEIVLTYIDLISFCLLTLIYFALGLKEFRENLRIKLKELSKMRYLFFYYTSNSYLLVSVFLLLGYYVLYFWNGNFYRFLVSYNTANVHNYISIPLFLLFSFSLMLYGFTELKWIKRFIPNSKIFKNQEVTYNQNHIEKRIQELLESKKIFKNPDLNLNLFSFQVGVKPNEIRSYLKNEKKINFTTFINGYRVKNFKSNLKNNKYLNYDLTGMAKESGFKSRASFYRVFKELEGMAPGDYKRKKIQIKDFTCTK